MIPPNADLTRPVRAFLKAQGDLATLEAGHRDARECGAYAYHKKIYRFSVPARALLRALCETAPEKLWVGDSRYQLTYDRDSGKVYVSGDDHPPLREGMVMVLDLRIVAPLHIPVAFEIVRLDPAAGCLAFGYVRSNRSQGLQRLNVYEDDHHSARVMHETWFHSGSTLRDRLLYPPFHERLMDRFYDDLSHIAATIPTDG